MAFRYLFPIALAFGWNSAAGAEAVRGMTISCQTWGWEWGTDAMVEAMKEVKALGVNWISIHPYGSVSRDGTVQLRRMNPDEPPPTWLRRPIEEAHRLGLKICITPHLAPWRSGWRWRGEISFDSEAEWDRFFSSYQEWIVQLAELCAGADAFVVGSELDQTVAGREAEWRSIISSVRRATPAALTYSANWSDYRRIPFWDALDVVGVSAYFPLVDQPGAPQAEEIEAGWNRIRRELNQFARSQGDKPVVLTEVGYDRSLGAAHQPWRDGQNEPGSERLQQQCLDAALAALRHDDHLIGAFIWKWFPGPVRRATFLASTPSMRAVIARHWLLPEPE